MEVISCGKIRNKLKNLMKLSSCKFYTQVMLIKFLLGYHYNINLLSYSLFIPVTYTSLIYLLSS